MKSEVKKIDAVPSKRLYWSIISDYNLRTALCELVDNAHDIWAKDGRKKKLVVKVELDVARQFIKVEDTAGGVKEESLNLLVSPGSSSNLPEDNVIGFFGVGTKRAVVALADEVKLQSRFRNQDSFQIDISKEWLDDPTWDIPYYKIDEMFEGTTVVEMLKLRSPLTDSDEDVILKHFGETYAELLGQNEMEIFVNGKLAAPLRFDSWAFPPEFEPRNFKLVLSAPGGAKVYVEILAGLVREKEPGKEDYGVYFYCNNRLIAKELKDREVGYLTGYAGIPHSDASLARIIVRMNGSAMHMPWNSSKSSIAYSHVTFNAFRDFLISTVTQFSSLSRRLKGQWPEKVFAYSEGEIKSVLVQNPMEIKRAHLPELPKVTKHHLETLLVKNRKEIESQPWVLGLLEGVEASETVRTKKFQTKNRIALLLLDSTVEIAIKEYIVHNSDLELGGKTLKAIFDNRELAFQIVMQKVKIDAASLSKIRHYYQMRNKLIHERATVDVVDADIENYTKLSKKLLKVLFGLAF